MEVVNRAAARGRADAKDFILVDDGCQERREGMCVFSSLIEAQSGGDRVCFRSLEKKQEPSCWKGAGKRKDI